MTGATVLVVDDDPAFRAFLRAALELEGFSVDEAEDGDGAVACALRGRPGAILLDWRMPGQSGIVVLRRLRAHRELDAVRIAMVTGLSDSRDRHLARRCGADAFLVKDGDPATMVGQVRELLAGAPDRVGQ